METYTFVMALLGGLLIGAAAALLHMEKKADDRCAECRRRKHGECTCKHKNGKDGKDASRTDESTRSDGSSQMDG